MSIRTLDQKSKRKPKPLDVAIVGMACRFPGADDLCAFWENIVAGRDSTDDAPTDRWDPQVFHDPDSPENDRVPCRRGGYLGSTVPLDPTAHGIMPQTVEGGEPEQFLVLDAAIAALRDAGLDPDAEQPVFNRHRVEVIIGRGNDFNRGNLTRLQHGRIIAQTLDLLAALHPDWSADDLERLRHDLKASLPPFDGSTVPGQLTNATAARIAQRLDLTGPSYVVDAASASSLIAVELGARALVERRADLCLVGGVYLEADVDFPLVFRQLNALSRCGLARPFAADADGMLPGEGVGVVALKRLADAERAGDRVYAVLKGLGTAGDGRGHGLASPSARGHARAMRRAYRRSGIEPGSIGLIEGHALGVPAADTAELRALRAAFPPPVRGRRTLTAVSSMIGHAMPAAGIAGVIKTALALFHRVRPPTLHAENPHPLLRRSDAPATLNANARPWIQGDPEIPRRAGVNAFGFAGINIHAILEEHTASADAPTPGALLHWDREAVLLSGEDRGALIDRARRLLDWLRRVPSAPLKDVAFSLNRAAAGPVRLGLVASDLADLAERLAAVLPRLEDPECRSIKDARGAYFWDEPLGAGNRRLAFLFPGEGSQYPGMMADLCLHFPQVRALFDTSDHIALRSGEETLPSERIFFSEYHDIPTYESTELAVNAVLSSQWAMYRLLRSLELEPEAVVGHSSGELLALAAAGAIETDTALEETLGRLGTVFRQLERSGRVPQARLTAVATNRERAEAAISAAGSDALIAIDNCPHQVILAGSWKAVEAVVAPLRAEGVLCDDLPFSRAYHTPSFEPVLDPIRESFAGLAFSPPSSAAYSCALAGRLPTAPEAIRRLAVDQWSRPVAFRQTIETMYRDGLRLFLDLGARGHLAGFVEDILRGRPMFAVAAHSPRRSGTAQLGHLVASLFAQGLRINPHPLYERRRPQAVDFEAPVELPRPNPELRLSFPAPRLSEATLEHFANRTSNSERDYQHINFPDHNPSQDTRDLRNSRRIRPSRNGSGTTPAAWRSYFDTMNAFLETQQAVMTAYLAERAEPRLPSGDSSNGNGFHRKNGAALEPASRAPWPANPRSTAATAEPCADPTRAAGPWAGVVIERSENHVHTRWTLDANNDPIAEHHTLGGRRVSARDPSLRGLPVLPFSVMAEMVAQVGALLAPKDAFLVELRDVRAARWVKFEDRPSDLELRGARVDDDPWAVRVTIHKPNDPGAPDSGETAPVFEGTAVFGMERPGPASAAPFELSETFASRFTARSLYNEQWLFHGPVMRALASVGPVSRSGISGSIRVLPLAPLFQNGQRAQTLIDPIVLDTFTHLLGCWGLDCLGDEGGDVIFPLEMGSLRLFGAAPEEGSLVDCRIRIRSFEHSWVLVDAEILRPDGHVWMQIEAWRDWRFHWPNRYRDVFRGPESIFVGEELPLAAPPHEVQAVWLEPPTDMGRPIWRDVLEQVQLAPEERKAFLEAVANVPAPQRARRLWGRIAAKEAARRLGRSRGGPHVFPADLRIETDAHGRPWLHSGSVLGLESDPVVSIAHCEGVAVAIASINSSDSLGIDIEPIVDRSSDFLDLAFTEAEIVFLHRIQGIDRAEALARFWCAKEAAAKATGFGLLEGPKSLEIVHGLQADGSVGIRLGPGFAAACPALAEQTIKVQTARQGDRAWAWTLGREFSS